MRARRLQHASLYFGLTVLCFMTGIEHVAAQSAKIEWEVANRFRLFAEQSDFENHVKAYRASGSKSVFNTEQKLIVDNRGKGWARNVQRLCFDSSTGQVLTRCLRDGEQENYINPENLRIKLSVVLPADFGEASCTWQVRQDKPIVRKCDERLLDERVVPGTATQVTVTARNQSNATLSATVSVLARDVLIVGMGDSIASGEGNPTEPVALSDNGFCFRRPFFIGSGRKHEFFLPGRARAKVSPNCPAPDENLDQRDAWDAAAARWMYSPCHRSLYSYQARAALALAVENPELSVTFIPLGCSGATIRSGMLGPQDARERPKTKGKAAPRQLPSQVSQLSGLLGISKGNPKPIRRPDLILLTIGANDVGFGGLIANIVIKERPERDIAKRLVVEPDKARARLGQLREDFKNLRRSLLSFTGDNLQRVVFVTYPNPGLNNGQPCQGTRLGFDAQPAFSVDGDKLATTVQFVDKELVPALRDFAICGNGAACANSDRERMTHADQFRAAFANHGFCAASAQDPEFDRQCFRNGNTFNGNPRGLREPMACQPDHTPGEFRAYATRARWFRTVNDSYFTAMTYLATTPFLNPTDIHDALWGMASVVHGGAMHPTAEGHAVMADGTLPEARKILKLPPR